MAQIIKRFHPFDTRQNIKLGVAYPLNKKSLNTGTNTVREQMRTNLIDLLVTYPGERINLPDYGIGLKQLLFEQNVDLISLKELIIKQAAFYIPNILVTDVELGTSEDEHSLFISITYRSILDNSEDSIQLNFN